MENLLTIKNNEGREVPVIDSREVAKMLEIEHKYILRSIEGTDKVVGIIPTLESGGINVANYFTKSSYKAGTREYKCYLCTKMGCELLCLKTNGNKGILLSTLFQDKFEKLFSEKDIRLNYDVQKVCDTLKETSKRKEIYFLEKLEEALKPFELKVITQFPVKNRHGGYYRIDFYIPSKNIAIEYDENSHKGYSYESHEGRQKYIEQEIGCRFIRVTDENSDEYNVGLVIKEMFNIKETVEVDDEPWDFD